MSYLPKRTSITPGQVWTDTAGNRIHAHGGSLIHVDGTFYWYGENKERSIPGAESGTGGFAATRRRICTTGPTKV